MVEKVETGARIVWLVCWSAWVAFAALGYLYAWTWFAIPAYEGVTADMGKWASLFTGLFQMGLMAMGGFGLLVVASVIADKGFAFIGTVAAAHSKLPAEEPTE